MTATDSYFINSVATFKKKLVFKNNNVGEAYLEGKVTI
jgi:hypothetical protein